MKSRLFSLLLISAWLHSAAVTTGESQSEQHIHAESAPPLAGMPESQQALARLVREQSQDLASLEAAAGARLDARARTRFTRLRREILELQKQVLRREVSPTLLRVELHSHRKEGFPRSYADDVAAEREEAARFDALVREVFAASRALPRQTFADGGWLSPETVTIPDAPIRRVHIDFGWAGLGPPQNREYVIKKAGHGDYDVDTGITVDTSTIESLAFALTDLRPTIESQFCNNHTDNYPSYELTVEFESGEQATISSQSNCHGNIPWNVTWQGRNYVQYGVVLAEAVHRLLHKLDPEMWMRVKFRLHPDSQYRIGVLKTPGLASRPPEKRVEAESFLTLLSADPNIAAFLDSYDLVGVDLHCRLTSENPDCARLNGKLTLASHHFNATYKLNVETNASVVTKTSASRLDLDAANRELRDGGKLRRMWEVNPNAWLHVDWLGLRDEPGMSSAGGEAHAVFRAVHPDEVTTAALVSLRTTKSAARFLYLPDQEELWVTYYSLEHTPADRDRNLPSFGKLMELFDREPGAVAAIRELLILDCSRLIAEFYPRFVETHPGYIKALEQVHSKITHHENRVSNWGYCVRVQEDGSLAPVYTGDAR